MNLQNISSLKLPSSHEMRNFDQSTISSGVPALVLMERAGKGVFDCIKQKFKPSNKGKKKPQFLILAGTGNNGGDGLVLARYLKKAGFNLKVVISASTNYSSEFISQVEKLTGFKDNLFIWGSASIIAGKKFKSISCETFIEQLLQLASNDFIIDALLGTGASLPPRGAICEMLDAVGFAISDNPRKPKIIAIDLPSGMDADTGQISNNCIKADLTICIELIKRGCYQAPANVNCGELATINIGIKTDSPCEFKLLDSQNFQLSRRANAHKGDFGRVLVIGGSRNMTGAAALAAKSALRTGAGLVTATCFLGQQHSFPMEIICETFENREGCYAVEHLELLQHKLPNFDVVVVGPGIGTSTLTSDFVLKLLEFLKTLDSKVVIDADALNILANDRALGSQDLSTRAVLNSNFVLTPHPAEMARLLRLSTEQVQADRYTASMLLANKTRATVVLKGASSIIYSNDRGVVNTTGNPFMASAGSGDVLSGIIAGLLAQGLDSYQAAQFGVHLHGLAADQILEKRKAAIIASDLIEQIPYSVSQFYVG